MESLTEKVLRYQRTRAGLAELMTELAQRVYLFPRRQMGWDEDACGEFYLFFHPRLVRLLDRFRDQGKPFESYLCAVLGWQLRNFARERKQGERSWNVGLRIEPCQTENDEEEAPRGEETVLGIDGDVSALIRTPADRRNLLFLILKCSRTVDPEKIAALAGLACVSPERLTSLVTDLAQLRTRREARLETFRLRRNGAFSQVRLLETEIMVETDNDRRAELSRRLQKARRRMRSAMTRMASVGLAPTNKEISAILEVPKGTVDSGLYWLKKKLAQAASFDQGDEAS